MRIAFRVVVAGARAACHSCDRAALPRFSVTKPWTTGRPQALPALRLTPLVVRWGGVVLLAVRAAHRERGYPCDARPAEYSRPVQLGLFGRRTVHLGLKSDLYPFVSTSKRALNGGPGIKGPGRCKTRPLARAGPPWATFPGRVVVWGQLDSPEDCYAGKRGFKPPSDYPVASACRRRPLHIAVILRAVCNRSRFAEATG